MEKFVTEQRRLLELERSAEVEESRVVVSSVSLKELRTSPSKPSANGKSCGPGLPWSAKPWGGALSTCAGPAGAFSLPLAFWSKRP